MTTEERLRACHRHAVLRFLSGGRSRNAALCDRLVVARRNAVRLSGVIGQALPAPPADSMRPRSGCVPFRT